MFTQVESFLDQLCIHYDPGKQVLQQFSVDFNVIIVGQHSFYREAEISRYLDTSLKL